MAGLYSAKSRTQPVFSYSKWKGGKLEDGGADCSIIRAIAHHIDMTQPGDEVLIAISAWWTDGWPILKAVQEANDRAVTVQVIANHKDEGGNLPWYRISQKIWKPLESAIGPASIKYWKNTTSFPNISHNKFVLIRKGNGQHLVLITGANWAPFDIARHCDLLTLDSKAIWSEFRKYWYALWDSPKNAPGAYKAEVNDPETAITAHFWPVLDMFGAPDPLGGTWDKNPLIRAITKYQPEPTTKIRIIASNWHTKATPGMATPGKDMLTLLQIYNGFGADVRVIGNHHLDRGCHNKNETTADVFDFLNENSIPWAKCPPHAKVILVSGRQADNKIHQSVYTGSMNISYEYNKGAMPDAFVGVHDDPLIFSQYEAWWKWLCHNTALSRGGSDSGLVCGLPQLPLPQKG